jgi:hypothetical protein
MAFPRRCLFPLVAAFEVWAQAPVVLVSGSGANVPLAQLGLGDGGVGEESRAGRAPLVAQPGDVLTPGGIRLRARAEGVKLDFPSGAEVLVTPSLRLCLRSGEQTLPALGRLDLSFADGTRLELEGDGGGRRPLRRATLVQGALRHVFWPARQAATVEAGHARAAARTPAYLVLGDGRCVYRAVPLGPVLGLRAILHPRDGVEHPRSRVVVAGDVLASSLRRLPAHVPREPVQFPQAPEAAQRLAGLAGELFAKGRIERPVHAKGPLVLPLPHEWQLRAARGLTSGFLTLGLYRADSTVPVVEWTVSPTRSELHLVRPFGGEHGGPRYFLRGIDLGDLLRELWPGSATADDLRWLDQELARLGAPSVREGKLAPTSAR